MLEVEGGPELGGMDGCPTVDRRLLVRPISDVLGVPEIQFSCRINGYFNKGLRNNFTILYVHNKN